MGGTVKLGQTYELELKVDAVRPKSSDSQQERNYNPRSRKGQIGIFMNNLLFLFANNASGCGFWGLSGKLRLTRRQLDLACLFVKPHICHIKTRFSSARNPQNLPLHY